MAADNCQISRNNIWQRIEKVGTLLAVALCNSIFWVEATGFCGCYWPGASMQSYKNLWRLSLNFEADQCEMEQGKIVYCWRKYSAVNNKEENAAEGSNWMPIMPMIKDNVLGKGDYRRVSVLGRMAKNAVIVAAEPSLAWAWYLNYRAATQKWAWFPVWKAEPSAAQLAGGAWSCLRIGNPRSLYFLWQLRVCCALHDWGAVCETRAWIISIVVFLENLRNTTSKEGEETKSDSAQILPWQDGWAELCVEWMGWGWWFLKAGLHFVLL